MALYSQTNSSMNSTAKVAQKNETCKKDLILGKKRKTLGKSKERSGKILLLFPRKETESLLFPFYIRGFSKIILIEDIIFVCASHPWINQFCFLLICFPL